MLTTDMYTLDGVKRMFYKSFYLWYNEMQKSWMIQDGYSVIKACKTLGAAKAAVTRIIKGE